MAWPSITEGVTKATKGFFEEIKGYIVSLFTKAEVAEPLSVLNYGATGNGRQVVGVKCSATGTTLEVKEAGFVGFTTADIGKPCCVGNEALEYGPVMTIAGVTSSTVVTLSENAGLSLNSTKETFFWYGSDESEAFKATFEAAVVGSQSHSSSFVGYNHWKSVGQVSTIAPALPSGRCYFLAKQVEVPPGVSFGSPALIVNALPSRTAFPLVFAPTAQWPELHIECLNGAGFKFGEAAGTQSDIDGGKAYLWGVGREEGVEGVAFTGGAYRFDLIWMKGGGVGVNFNPGSDCSWRAIHAIGCAQAVKIVEANQMKGHVILDTCGRSKAEIEAGAAEVDGISIDKGSSDIDITAQVFESGSVTPPRKLKAVSSVGRNFVSGGNSIDLKISVQSQLSGGTLAYLSHCEDVQLKLQGSNKKTNSSGTPGAENEITAGVEYGANVEGTIDVTGSGSSSIKPLLGTVGGWAEWIQKGVLYRHQSYAFPPTFAVGANIGSGGTVAFSANECSDQCGFVEIKTGTLPTAGEQLKATFANKEAGFGYLKTPKVELTPRNEAASGCQWFVSGDSRTGFSISMKNPTSSTAYQFSYAIVS